MRYKVQILSSQGKFATTYVFWNGPPDELQKAVDQQEIGKWELLSALPICCDFADSKQSKAEVLRMGGWVCECHKEEQ